MPVEDFFGSADGLEGNVSTACVKQLVNISQRAKTTAAGKGSAGHRGLSLIHSWLYLGVSETGRRLNPGWTNWLSVSSTNKSTASVSASPPPPSSLHISPPPPRLSVRISKSDSVPLSSSPFSPPALTCKKTHAMLISPVALLLCKAAELRGLIWKTLAVLWLQSLMYRFQNTDRMTGSEGRQSAGRQERDRKQLTEVITLAFISIKMSPQRRNWWRNP